MLLTYRDMNIEVMEMCELFFAKDVDVEVSS